MLCCLNSVASHRQCWSFLGHNCISGGCCPVVGHLCPTLPITVDSGGLFSWLAWFNHWEKAEDQSWINYGYILTLILKINYILVLLDDVLY